MSGKKVLLPLIISEISKGNSPSQICKKHNISKQNLNYYLRQLKNQGRIVKESYGVWRVVKEVKTLPKACPSLKSQIRGHAFNWRVKFLRDYDWLKYLKRGKISYTLIGAKGNTPRIIFNGKKIWLTKTGLIVYEPKSFFSDSSASSKGMAVYELDKTIKMLERAFKTSLGEYYFTTSREHFGMVKNELARQYNNKGEKLYIRDDNGIWMWIDDSHSLNELETNNVKTSRQVQTWYNDHKKHNFEVNSSFILNSLHQVTQNQLMFDNNFQSHLEVIRELGESVKLLKEEIRRLSNAKT